jgi:hypothetical protein
MKRMKQFRIEESLWQSAKVAAAKRGVTLESWLVGAIDYKVTRESLTTGFTPEDIKDIKAMVEGKK